MVIGIGQKRRGGVAEAVQTPAEGGGITEPTEGEGGACRERRKRLASFRVKQWTRRQQGFESERIDVAA